MRTVPAQLPCHNDVAASAVALCSTGAFAQGVDLPEDEEVISETIVVTANHYIVDAIAGGVVALVGLLLASQLQRHSSPATDPVDADPARTVRA